MTPAQQYAAAMKPVKRSSGVARRYPEQELQIMVADYLRLACPRLVWWFVPNGGNLSKAQRGRFQRMGLLPGVADLHMILSGGRLGMIELKVGKGRQSSSQGNFEVASTSAGALYLICKSLAEVKGALAAWDVPSKATVEAA